MKSTKKVLISLVAVVAASAPFYACATGGSTNINGYDSKNQKAVRTAVPSKSGAVEATPIVLAQSASATLANMSDGEVRKVDRETMKITIKHGEIKNLEMPGMTMVFQIKDPAILGQLKVGDKIKFSAEKQNGALVVTAIKPGQ